MIEPPTMTLNRILQMSVDRRYVDADSYSPRFIVGKATQNEETSGTESRQRREREKEKQEERE